MFIIIMYLPKNFWKFWILPLRKQINIHIISFSSFSRFTWKMKKQDSPVRILSRAHFRWPFPLTNRCLWPPISLFFTSSGVLSDRLRLFSLFSVPLQKVGVAWSGEPVPHDILIKLSGSDEGAGIVCFPATFSRKRERRRRLDTRPPD